MEKVPGGLKQWIRCPGCQRPPHQCAGRSECSCRQCWARAIEADALQAVQRGTRPTILLVAELLDLIVQKRAREKLGAQRQRRGKCLQCGGLLSRSPIGRPRRTCGDKCRSKLYRVNRLSRGIREVMSAKENEQFAQDLYRVTAPAGFPVPDGRGGWQVTPGAPSPPPKPPRKAAEMPPEWAATIAEWDADAG